MTAASHLRIGSLEILAAFLLVTVLAAKPRLTAASEIGQLVPMAVALRVFEGAGVRLVETLAPVTVGREKTSGVVLDDPEVSRSHARLESQHGAIFLRDLQSRNGTFLNGERVGAAVEIREGDEIDVGTTRLAVESISPWT